MSKTRILIPAYGVNVEALKVGLAATEQICNTQKCNALLMVPALKEASSTALNEIFTKEQLKMMEKGASLQFESGHTLTMCSPLTLKNQRTDGVIFAVFASEKIIDKAESAFGVKGIVVVTWNNNDANKWVESTTPQVVTVPVNDDQ